MSAQDYLPEKSAVRSIRLQVGGKSYVCLNAPVVEAGGSAEKRLETAAAGLEPPVMFYWDALTIDPDGGRIRWGSAGIDPILVREIDLAGCVAIQETVLRRLVDRKALSDEADLGRAAALLVNGPGLVYVEGLSSLIDADAPGPFRTGGSPPVRADSVSIVVLVDPTEVDIVPFFSAVRNQTIVGHIDVIIVASGLEAPERTRLSRAIEICSAADARLRVRRYLLSGQLPGPYAANVGVALSTSEAVVVADPGCAPASEDALQLLSDWALSGDAVASCPRIIHEGHLVAAGLALYSAGGRQTLDTWSDPVLINTLRTVAAPAPGLFAVRRSAWLAAGGLKHGDQSHWTAAFASLDGPRGRTLLVGSATAEWMGEPPITSPSEISSAVQPQETARMAVRDPARPLEAHRLSSPALPSTASVAGIRPGVAFSDRFPTSAPMRVLVFADGLGASQEITFVHGLARARAEGAVAVRIIEEAAFPDDRAAESHTIRLLVERHFEETAPTVVVASRLGDPAIWNELRAVAHRAGTPIIFHIDDDLFDLPAVLGVERYRLARNPLRIRTLRECLAAADLTITSTQALADRIAEPLGHRRIMAIDPGSAGRAPSFRPERHSPGKVVIGYMGSASHDHDLNMIVPALNAVSDAFGHVDIVLFGSIASQPAARRLRGRVTRHAPVIGDYTGFRSRLNELGLDIGLAPLRDLPFNAMKTPTKWVEYAEAGAATLVSPAPPYLEIAAANAALTAGPDEWERKLRRLVLDGRLRGELVRKADVLLADRFSWSALEAQVVGALRAASEAPAQMLETAS